MKDFESFKKITTEDCVNAICELLYHQGKSGADLNKKNWKRRSKSGSDIIVREFENTATGQVMIVFETKGKIFRITEEKDKPKVISNEITVKDVNDWTDEFQEDPMIDGPIYMSEEHEEEFMKSLPRKFVHSNANFDGWCLSSLNCVDGCEDEIIQLWVDFLNKKGYKNGYKEMLDDVKSTSEPKDIFSDLKGSVLFPDENLSKDFPFVYTFDFATVYSKSKINDRQFSDETEEIENDDYDSSGLSKDKRIGILNYEESDIETLILITSNTVFYSNNGDMTNDGISYFELAKGVHYVPAQEPVDLLETGFENGGGCEIENADKMRKVAKKYKLNHFLMSV